MNVIIIYGGKSGEHEISLLSAAAIIRNINKSHNLHLIGINKNGVWYHQNSALIDRVRSGSPLTIEETDSEKVSITLDGTNSFWFGKQQDTKAATTVKNGDATANNSNTTVKNDDATVVFPMLHGSYGEDGTIQGLLEMCNIAYVGCNVLSSAVTMDKDFTKKIVNAAGVKVVPYICMTREQLNDKNTYDKIFNDAVNTLGFPLFIKPCNAGSSNGASRATNARLLSYALMEAFMWDNKVLIEKAINAREIECSVTGLSVTNSDCANTKVTSYELGEIRPSSDFYDFDSKYNNDSAALDVPAVLPKDLHDTIMATARLAYGTLNCSGLARVDFFLSKDDGTLYFNELNSLPGFTKISMFPKLCESAGLNFTDLIDLLLNEALESHKAKAAIQTSR